MSSGPGPALTVWAGTLTFRHLASPSLLVKFRECQTPGDFVEDMSEIITSM